jgi:hypothetical protein
MSAIHRHHDHQRVIVAQDLLGHTAVIEMFAVAGSQFLVQPEHQARRCMGQVDAVAVLGTMEALHQPHHHEHALFAPARIDEQCVEPITRALRNRVFLVDAKRLRDVEIIPERVVVEDDFFGCGAQVLV